MTEQTEGAAEAATGGRSISPLWKNALEYGPVALFFLAYLKLKSEVFEIGGTSYEGFIVVTAGFVPLMILSTLILWRLTGKLSRMQVLTLVIIVIFGGLSVWFNDERFFKMKPTMIYLLFGGLIGVGLLRGESYLRVMMEEVIALTEAGWMILTRRICAFFFALAVANEAIWRLFTTETWVYFKTFGLTAAMFLFFMTQAKLFQTHGVDEGTGEGNGDAES